jgi:hypothetical protein
MSTDELIDVLRILPPTMDGDPDRFDSIERRVRRRERHVFAAVIGTVAATVVVVATAVLVSTSSTTQSDSTRVATAPPTPTRTADVTYEDPGPLPGSTTTVDLGAPVEVTAAGTSTVDLGAHPDGANAANVSVMCLTSGRIEFPDGGSMVCEDPPTDAELADPRSGARMLVDLEQGQTTLTFKARPDVGWKVVATYVRATTSEWGVNANGETYGVQRLGKTPDLVAVFTIGGKQGYAYASELNRPVPTSPADALEQQEAQAGDSRSVPVYELDGETVIGEFLAGG